MINEQAVEVLQDEMTPDAADIFAELCEFADNNEEHVPVYFSADNPLWKKGGFDQMDKDVRLIFRRIVTHFGREISFEKEGMIVWAHQKVRNGSSPVS